MEAMNGFFEGPPRSARMESLTVSGSELRGMGSECSAIHAG